MSKLEWTPELQKQLDASPDKDAFMDNFLAGNDSKLSAEEKELITKVIQSGKVPPDAWVEYRRTPRWAFWNGTLRWRLTVKCCDKHEPKVYARFMDKEHGHHMAMLIAQSLGRKYGNKAVMSIKRDGKPESVVDIDTDED